MCTYFSLFVYLSFVNIEMIRNLFFLENFVWKCSIYIQRRKFIRGLKKNQSRENYDFENDYVNMKGICRLQERIFCKCRGGVEYNTVNSKMSNFDYRRNMGEKEISMCSNQNFFKEISKNNSRSNLEICELTNKWSISFPYEWRIYREI